MSTTTRGLSTIVIVLSVVFLGACASSGPTETEAPPPRAALRAIPLGTNITVLGVQPGAETPDVETAGETVAGATAAGAGGGALYGAAGGAVAGLACGPLFVICSPVAAVAGAVGGAILGATVLGVREAALSVPAEQAEALEAIMAGTITDLGVSQPLVDAFSAQKGDRWAIANTGEGPSVMLEIEQLYVDQGTSDMLVMKVVSSMAVSYGPPVSETTRRMLFPYTSGQRDVDDWIADDGAVLRAEIERAVGRQAADMIELLEGGMGSLGRVIRPIP